MTEREKMVPEPLYYTLVSLGSREDWLGKNQHTDDDCRAIRKAARRLRSLAEENARLRNLIRDAEWSDYARDGDGGLAPACPWCGSTKNSGHSEHCLARAALKVPQDV